MSGVRGTPDLASRFRLEVEHPAGRFRARGPWAAAVLLCLSAGPSAGVEGVSLRWNECYGDLGRLNRNFACNTNTGSSTLVASFELARDVPGVEQVTVVLKFASASSSLPAWWRLEVPGGCRAGSLSLSSDLGPSAANCLDWAEGGATTLLADYRMVDGSPTTSRLQASSAIAPGDGRTLNAYNEYFALRVVIDHARTTGEQACAACPVPVDICIESVTLHAVAGGPPVVLLTDPANQTDSDSADWQGGLAQPSYPCELIVPVRASTWGAVKSLYR